MAQRTSLVVFRLDRCERKNHECACNFEYVSTESEIDEGLAGHLIVLTVTVDAANATSVNVVTSGVGVSVSTY